MAYLGIDIGGTFVKLALVGRNGRVLARDRVATRASDGPETLLKRVARGLPDLLVRRRLEGAGIGCAGLIDVGSGRVIASPNLPAWTGQPIRGIARRVLGVQTIIENDVNAAAYGEYRRGAGRGARLLVCITLGTGVGGGIVAGGQVLRGAHNFAGEIGHMGVTEKGPRCRCGNRGCLEAYLGAYGLVRDARRRMRTRGSRYLASRVRAGEPLSPQLLGRAARAGDRIARAVFADASTHLGVAVASLVNLLNPDVIAIGGGVSAEYTLLAPGVRRVVGERAFSPSVRSVRIVRAALGNDAAPIGAAMLARDRFEQANRPKG